MPKLNKHYKRAARSSRTESLSGDSTLSLNGFRSADIPDVTAIKMVYSDYRVLTCSVNQAEYVYRLNSCFDCDQSGVGGQPMGYDQWKALYSVYRVVAVEVEVQAVGNGTNANGLLSVAPTDTAGGFLSAEEIGGLRHAKAAAFSPTQVAKVRALWRIGSLMGRSDETILADPNCSAAVTSNPTSQFYLTIGIESGNAAAGQAMVWTKITYYTRFEYPIATLDASLSHRARFRAALPPVWAPYNRLSINNGIGATPTLGGSAVQTLPKQPFDGSQPSAISSTALMGVTERVVPTPVPDKVPLAVVDSPALCECCKRPPVSCGTSQ